MTGERDPDRVPDAALWRSVAASLADVVAVLPPGHERDVAVQLGGLARYAQRRPPDDADERAARLAAVLGRPAGEPGDAGPAAGDRASAGPAAGDLVTGLRAAADVLAAAVHHPAQQAAAAPVRALLLEFLDRDTAAAAPLLETFAGHPAGDVEPADRAVPEGERRSLVGWFAAAYAGPVTLERAVVMSGGHSRRMLRVTVAHAGGRDELVVRVEQGGMFGTEGTTEAAAMRALAAAGVPVAPVRWVEPDPRPLGHPFFVMDLVPGSSAVDDASLDAFLVTLAAVHRLDPACATVALGAPPSPEEAVAAQLRRWREVYRASVSAPVPLLEEALAWLGRHLRPTGGVAVVHGDPGPGNFLHAGGAVTAVTDWEFVHYGDPAEDWAYFAALRARKLRPKQDWYRHLEGLVGVANPPAAWHAWEAFNQLKGACANLSALRVFREGAATTPNLLAIGTAVHLRFLRQLADLVAAA